MSLFIEALGCREEDREKFGVIFKNWLKEMGTKESLCILLVGMQVDVATKEVLQKLKIKVPHDPAIPLLDAQRK